MMFDVRTYVSLLILCLSLSYLFSISLLSTTIAIVCFAVVSKVAIHFLLIEIKKDKGLETFTSLQSRDERSHM